MKVRIIGTKYTANESDLFKLRIIKIIDFKL